MSQEFNEKKENNDSNSDIEYAYKNVMDGKQYKRTWSIISFALSIASVIFCFVPVVGLILGLAAIGFSLFSRKHLGYFDGLSLFGLMIGIFGSVFSVGAIVLKNILLTILSALFK